MCRQIGQLKRKAVYAVSGPEEETRTKLARMQIDDTQEKQNLEASPK